jgi:FkbM family methyltransferase
MPKSAYEIARGFLKSSLNALGFDLIRTKKLSQFNLCGLKNLQIKTIVDVGANQGQFARSMGAHFPEARFLCFEPLSGPYAALQNWARERPDRIRTFNLAIGDQDGEAQMFFHRDFSPSSSMLPSTKLGERLFPAIKKQECMTVKVLTLDHALESIQLDENILIKLDVQGYEDRILTGAQEVFRRAMACILEISLDPLYEGQADFRKLTMQLDQMHYRYAGNLEQVHADDGHVIYFDAVFLRNGTDFYHG